MCVCTYIICIHMSRGRHRPPPYLRVRIARCLHNTATCILHTRCNFNGHKAHGMHVRRWLLIGPCSARPHYDLQRYRTISVPCRVFVFSAVVMCPNTDKQKRPTFALFHFSAWNSCYKKHFPPLILRLSNSVIGSSNSVKQLTNSVMGVFSR